MKKLPKSQVEFELTISTEEVEKYFDKAAKHLSKHVEIKGFRKGSSVPKDVLEKYAGKQAIFQEASEMAIEEKYKEFVKKENIFPIEHPNLKVKKMAEGNPVEVTITVSVFPEVKLPDYKKISENVKKKRKKDVKVEEKDIKDALEHLRASKRKEVAVVREAKKGDIAEVDFEVRIDGVKIEGGDSKNHPVTLGDGKFIPGFEDNIEGMKAGEVKEFSVDAPKDYFKKDLAGKKMDFKVTLKSVLEVKLPDLDDEFAKSLGGFKTLTELEENLKKSIKMEKEQKEKEAFLDSLIGAIVKDSKIDLPEVMIKNEQEKIINEMKTNIEQHGLSFDMYLANLKKTIEEIKEDVKEQAEKRVKSVLVLEEIAKQEDIKPTEEEVTEKVNQTLLQYKSQGAETENINPEQLKAYAKMVLTNEKTLNFLENNK
jgi:trigger factor